MLFRSAGTNSDTPFLEIEEDEWDHIMDVNLKGVFLACQVAGKYLIEQGEGVSAAIELMLMMLPPSPCSIRYSPATWQARKTPFRLTSMMWSHSSSSISRNGVSEFVPALLTHTSICPD